METHSTQPIKMDSRSQSTRSGTLPPPIWWKAQIEALVYETTKLLEFYRQQSEIQENPQISLGYMARLEVFPYFLRKLESILMQSQNLK